ncbi:MAG: hypothetical protein GWN94_13990 [Phycisphaerae bacterium]|nr:hypothetical protein [Phycisphaerae bacterium]
MKRLLCILIALFLAIPSICFGAWTFTGTIDQEVNWPNNQKLIVIKVACASDGTDPAEFNLSDEMANSLDITKYQGGLFYAVETDPGADAPDAVWAVDFDTSYGADILNLTGLSITATEAHDGASLLGFNVPIFDIQIDLGDIGSSGDDVDLYIHIVK